MRPSRAAFAAQIGLMVAGVLIVLYPFTIGAAPALMCRDQVLQPGQVCTKADGTATQSYEGRVAAEAAAKPVVVGLGLAVLAFGGYLAWSSRRSKTQSP